jgi:hypothetical protein
LRWLLRTKGLRLRPPSGRGQCDGCILHPSRCVHHGCVRTRRACSTGASLRCRIRVQRRRSIEKAPPDPDAGAPLDVAGRWRARWRRSLAAPERPLFWHRPRAPISILAAPRNSSPQPIPNLSHLEPQSLAPPRSSAAAAVAHLRILTIRKNPRSCARARHLVPVRERERRGGAGMIATSSPTESGARVRAKEREQMRVNRACPGCVRCAYGVSGDIFFRFARRARWPVRIESRSSKRTHSRSFAC